ncbi:telomere length regulation protein TEL2 homolog [Saccostrea echinata]|uniref:telomere length regulation protein TEL2 homolog n=1 Tax=Saccostrea echinata TaxID=191078 RepID=UPI002A823840|nr:telomere length regulation protein TEL2 homolog [Saccostrea echinata]
MNILRNKMRMYVKETENSMKNPKGIDEVTNVIEEFYKITIGHEQTVSSKFQDVRFIREVFLTEFYPTVLKIFIDTLQVEWFTSPDHKHVSEIFDKVFLDGYPVGAFTVLMRSVDNLELGFRLNKCVSLLEKFLDNSGLFQIITTACKAAPDRSLDFLWEDLISLMATLPDKTANKLQLQNSEKFYPQHYIPLLCSEVMEVLHNMHQKLRNNNDIHLEFISRVVGKVCISGHAVILWNSLVPPLEQGVREDYIWSRITERIVTGVPDRCLECTLTALLSQLTWYGLVEKFIGGSVTTKQKIKYLLCTKLVFHRHSQDILLLQNIIGYLGSSHTRKSLLRKMLRELLSVWGDSSALKHTSVEQHLYITKALFIGLGFLKESDKAEIREDFIQLLMPGIQCHIASSDHRIRKIGMALAETISAVLDPKGQQLKFEFPRDEEVEYLVSLTTPPQDPGLQSLRNGMSNVNITPVSSQKDILTESGSEEREANLQIDPDLDSDDDLVPYDMSNDKKLTKTKQPKYIRDCMEGLISVDDPEKLEVCLGATEALIRRNPDGLLEIAEEFTKILLHLSDRYSTDNFVPLRFRSLVALAVYAPEQVSKYLTTQFYERNYNLRQRMDILEVLGAAAQELSQPSESQPMEKGKPSNKITALDSENSSEGWREIVKQRIESKTRRFGRGSRKEVVATKNKFAPVAGCFFYPLMANYDRKENTFDLMGEDSLVLARLVHTLGVIIYAAINTPAVKQMADRLLEFLWVIRFHSDVSVRHAVLFAVSMVILSVPGHILLTDLQSEIMETKHWLEDVVEKDVNAESKKVAIQSLVLLENVIKQEFTKGADLT